MRRWGKVGVNELPQPGCVCVCVCPSSEEEHDSNMKTQRVTGEMDRKQKAVGDVESIWEKEKKNG